MDELDPVTRTSLETFILRWYGPPDLPAPTTPLASDVPEALARWHRLASRRSIGLSRDHTMVPSGGPAGRTGETVFWTGPQDAYAYAPDGQVLEQQDGWVPTGVDLADFLVYIAVYEAIYAPLHGLVHLGGWDLRPLLDFRLVRLEDPLWTWPGDGRVFYADDDLLAHAGPDRTVISARHRDALGRFDGYPIEWDWDSRLAS